jgi:hypothetical protein
MCAQSTSRSGSPSSADVFCPDDAEMNASHVSAFVPNLAG